MNTLPRFEFFEPDTVEGAVTAMLSHGPRATLVAGGTGLFPTMKRRQVSHDAVVSLHRIAGLSNIRTDDGMVTVGALTPLSHVAASNDVPRGLAQAAGLVATLQIRAAGTLGGNLMLDTRCSFYDMPEIWREAQGDCFKSGGDICWVAPKGTRCWAISSTDVAPMALAMDATFRFQGENGPHEIPAASMYRDDGLIWLSKAPHDVLTEVVFPTRYETAYAKLRRRDTLDFPMLGVAVALEFDSDRTVIDARIGLGAVASDPKRARTAEAALTGRRLDPEVIAEAAACANESIRPLNNADVTSRYRRAMIEVYVKRALQSLN